MNRSINYNLIFLQLENRKRFLFQELDVLRSIHNKCNYDIHILTDIRYLQEAYEFINKNVATICIINFIFKEIYS